MGYTVADVADVPTVWGTFKFVRHALGARAFGLSQIDFPPDKVGSEHDERESRQEEVYVALSGGGTLEVDGETIEMKPGRYVLVTAESKRRPTAGPDGMSFLVIGGVPAASTSPGRRPTSDRPDCPLAPRRDEAVLRGHPGAARGARAAPGAGALLVNEAAERLGALLVAEDDEPVPGQLDELRAMIGRDPDLYEEFDVL